MALQVWLPLTKDLRNQGLSNVTVINNGATFNSAGKLGGCYKTSSTATIDLGYNGNQVNTGSISFGGWFNFNKAEIWSAISGKSYNTNANAATGCLIGNNSYGGVSLQWYTNNIYTSNSLTALYVQGYLRSSTNGARATSGFSLPFDTWVHIYFTFDKVSNIMTLYINGENKYTYTNVAFSDARNYNLFVNLASIAGGNGPAASIPFLVNDIRIYDHCLSPMEVKQISQGLILHYPLNRNGWGQENLMPNSVNMPLGSANPTTGTWRLAGSSQMERSRVAISDAPISSSAYGFQSVGLQTGPDASCWGIDGFPRKNGTTYTISAWGRIVGSSSTAAMLGFSIYSATTLDYGGTYGKAKSVDSEYYGSGGYDYFGGRLNPNGNWTRIYRTFTSNSTSDNIYVGFNTAKTGSSVTVQVCGIKLEEGDKMTTWTPHINEDMYSIMGLNGTTEYDCSGFCNNGTKVGTLGWSSNTPKYNVSLDVTTDSCARYIYGPAQTQLTDQITLACWLYQTSATATSGGNSTTNQFALSQGRDYLNLGFNITVNNGKPGVYAGNGGSESGARVSLISTTKTITGSWHHVAATYNNGALKLYVDGQLDRETTIGALDYVDAPALVIGKMAYGYTNATSYFPFVGYISDARIYATALSADDVKSLYQNCATIDSDGTIHGQIRS